MPYTYIELRNRDTVIDLDINMYTENMGIDISVGIDIVVDIGI